MIRVTGPYVDQGSKTLNSDPSGNSVPLGKLVVIQPMRTEMGSPALI
jgi:hypothetical protein